MPNETVTSTTSTTNTASLPSNMLEQLEALRAAGATIGIPLVVSLDEKTIAAFNRGSQPPAGQDLGRFTMKAGIATGFAFLGALGFWWVTKPVEPGM